MPYYSCPKTWLAFAITAPSARDLGSRESGLVFILILYTIARAKLTNGCGSFYPIEINQDRKKQATNVAYRKTKYLRYSWFLSLCDMFLLNFFLLLFGSDHVIEVVADH